MRLDFEEGADLVSVDDMATHIKQVHHEISDTTLIDNRGQTFVCDAPSG